MKKNEICELVTTKVDKLRTNFKCNFFDQYAIWKEGDKVNLTISLFSIENSSYFYKKLVAEKLVVALKLKATAAKFFKE